MNSLQAFLVEHLRATGLSQTRLAEDAGLTKAEINGIVQGRIKLPGADKRRRLAKALGVSHLDLLVAAGEITDQELGSVAGVVERDPDDVRERICELVRSMPEHDRLVGVELMLKSWKESG